MLHVSTPTSIAVDRLIKDLQRLCAQPTSSGQMQELAATASLVADMLRQVGLAVKVVQTKGAPVVLGWKGGRTPFTLLLYHHYDVAPTGPWRAWFHEPFQLAEREGVIYGRGVAHGKGPLVAHMAALRTLLTTEGDLPCGLVMVVEGAGLTGSPELEEIILQHIDLLRADAGLGSNGERDEQKRPFCYSGTKGLLQIELQASGSAHALPPGLAASVINPAWRLIWALGHLKGDDEDIRINGFYDMVEGPTRNENIALRQTKLDETDRKVVWNLPEFLFGMTGISLVRAEVTLPTCNLSSFKVEPDGHLASIPTLATARLDFHLVPAQHPDVIFSLVQEQLIARSCTDIKLTRLPGGYPPARTSPDHRFIQHLVATGIPVYGEPLTLLPSGPFSQPLALFAQHLRIPVGTVALARNDSAILAANEHIPLEDLVRHGQLLIELMVACGGQASSVGQ